MSLLAGERVALLVGATAQLARQEVLFDRDETDSYRLRIEPVRADRPRQVTRAEVMPALPVGSRWADAVGWESYVVFPLSPHADSDSAVLVALEYVEPHPSRGAYPVLAGVVVRMADVARALVALAAGLDPQHSREVADYGAVFSEARSVDEHRPIAAAILRAASTVFAGGKPLLVRTVVLTQDEVPPVRAVLPFAAGALLLGTVAPLRSRFSWKAKGILEGLR